MGTRNTLGDLNNHLFEAMERINDCGLKGESLDEEIKKANAVTKVAGQIISNASLVLNAAKFQDSRINADKDTPRLLKGD